MFANIYLEIESLVRSDLDANEVYIGLVKDFYSLYSIDVDLIKSKAVIQGYDKMKGEEFKLIYHYQAKNGIIYYLSGTSKRFTL